MHPWYGMNRMGSDCHEPSPKFRVNHPSAGTVEQGERCPHSTPSPALRACRSSRCPALLLPPLPLGEGGGEGPTHATNTSRSVPVRHGPRLHYIRRGWRWIPADTRSPAAPQRAWAAGSGHSRRRLFLPERSVSRGQHGVHRRSKKGHLGYGLGRLLCACGAVAGGRAVDLRAWQSRGVRGGPVRRGFGSLTLERAGQGWRHPTRSIGRCEAVRLPQRSSVVRYRGLSNSFRSATTTSAPLSSRTRDWPRRSTPITKPNPPARPA